MGRIFQGECKVSRGDGAETTDATVEAHTVEEAIGYAWSGSIVVPLDWVRRQVEGYGDEPFLLTIAGGIQARITPVDVIEWYLRLPQQQLEQMPPLVPLEVRGLDPLRPGGEGGAGVREPRRPKPFGDDDSAAVPEEFG